MAALLPGKTLKLIPSNSNVLRDGLSTQGAGAREQVLKQKSTVKATVLSATDLLAMTVEQGREAIKPYRLIYIAVLDLVRCILKPTSPAIGRANRTSLAQEPL
jgi:hypothetical protein